MTSSPTTTGPRPVRWGAKRCWGFKELLAAVAVCVLSIVIPCSVSAMLPDPRTTNPLENVVVRGPDGQELPILGADGAPLRCPRSTRGLFEGWECDRTRITTQTMPTPEDIDLALRRSVRAVNSSTVPTDSSTVVDGTSMLRLSPQRARAYASGLPSDGEIGAYAINDQLGMREDTVIVVVEGDPDLVAAVQESILAQGNGRAS